MIDDVRSRHCIIIRYRVGGRELRPTCYARIFLFLFLFFSRFILLSRENVILACSLVYVAIYRKQTVVPLNPNRAQSNNSAINPLWAQLTRSAQQRFLALRAHVPSTWNNIHRRIHNCVRISILRVMLSALFNKSGELFILIRSSLTRREIIEGELFLYSFLIILRCYLVI